MEKMLSGSLSNAVFIVLDLISWAIVFGSGFYCGIEYARRKNNRRR